MSDKTKFNWSDFITKLKMYIKNYWWKFLIVAFALSLDLVLKAVLVPQSQENWHEIVLIKDILTLTPTRNIGAGFSILEGQTWFLISLTILFIVALLFFNIIYSKKSKLYGISTALIMAGAIGNLIDRILFGYVRDFIYLKFINFPVFNIADMALTFGIILLLLYIIFYTTKKTNNEIKSQSVKKLSNDKANVTKLKDDLLDNNVDLINNIQKEDIEEELNENSSQKYGETDAKDSN